MEESRTPARASKRGHVHESQNVFSFPKIHKSIVRESYEDLATGMLKIRGMIEKGKGKKKKREEKGKKKE